ncbi:MAG: alpha/beta hydrolase [Azoarcus sp.]|jgi:pimeloyl-ACP methyl ester carboxylesterase|nr:alpha/beta hydrolase [Azoarcus sp.]
MNSFIALPGASRDGGSIALIAAAGGEAQNGANRVETPPACAAGIVAIAPHDCVEDICLAGIARARAAYERGDLRERLAKYHRDVDSAFHGGCDAWLAPQRRGWNIASLLPDIACPMLAIQGRQDEYATLEQIEAIGRRAPRAERLILEPCGHFPHLTHADAVIDGIAAFIGDRN